MPRVLFTSNLQRHVACPDQAVAALSVREALQKVFEANPAVRDYIVDSWSCASSHLPPVYGVRFG